MVSTPDDTRRIKKELSMVSGNALYLRVLELIKQGKLSLNDWHSIGYQKIYERLMGEGFDIVKIKTLNAEWRRAMGIQKRKGIRIKVQEKDSSFSSGVVFAHPLYDYVQVGSKKIPIMSGYGFFKEQDPETGKEMLVAKWRTLPISNFIDFEPRIKWLPTNKKHDMSLLLHWPEYHKKIMHARLSVLFMKIKSRITENIALEDSDLYDIISLWILATHFSRVFDHFPLLDLFKSGYNAGGSVALKTIVTYCPRPMLVQDPSEASLFRFANDFRPTIGIEEFTSDMDELKRKTIATLIDGSFDKNIKVPRTDRGIVSGFDFFGPKVVVDPQGLISRYSTASRTLFIPLINSPARNSDPDTLAEGDKDVIRALYDSFFVYSNKIERAYRSSKITGDGRLDQAFRPLLAVALVLRHEGIDVLDNLSHVLQEQFERREAIKSEGDITKQVLAAIYDIVNQEEEAVKNGKKHAWFRESTTKGDDGNKIFYVRTSHLRSAVSSQLGVEFQSDSNKSYGTRYWKKPSKDISEIVQDAARFNGILRTFIPEFIGNVEPGSRHLCLYYAEEPSRLIERLISIIGFNPTDSHNFPHVGYYIDPVFSGMLNKKDKKIPQKIKDTGKKDRRRKGGRVCSPGVLGYFEYFFTQIPNNSTSADNPTGGKVRDQEIFSKESSTACGKNLTKNTIVGDEAKLQQDSKNSGLQNENFITEDKGGGTIQSLLNEGIHDIPNESGISLDKRNFKIAIKEPSIQRRRIGSGKGCPRWDSSL